MINYDKINEELTKVQKGKRQHTFTIDEIIKLVEQTEQKKAELLKDKLNKKYFKSLCFHMRYDVSRSYKYSTETTVIWGNINRRDKVTIHIERKNALHSPYGGLDIKFEAVYE